MLNFKGRLTQNQYFVALLKIVISFLIVSGLLSWGLDLLKANEEGASKSAEAMAIILLTMLLLSVIFFLLTYTVAVIKRGRDAGNAVLWAVLSYIIPFGFLVIGLLPSKRNP